MASFLRRAFCAIACLTAQALDELAHRQPGLTVQLGPRARGVARATYGTDDPKVLSAIVGHAAELQLERQVAELVAPAPGTDPIGFLDREVVRIREELDALRGAITIHASHPCHEAHCSPPMAPPLPGAAPAGS